jgi:hypothetical protein
MVLDWDMQQIMMADIDDFNRFLEVHCHTEEEKIRMIEQRQRFKNREAARRSREKIIENTNELKHENNQYTQLLRKTELKNEEILKILEERKKEHAELKLKYTQMLQQQQLNYEDNLKELMEKITMCGRK